MKNCFILIWIFAPFLIYSQKHDYVWLMGYDTSLIVPGGDGLVMDFNETPVFIYYEQRDMNFQRTNASICDTAGNLLFYTNGIYIANAQHEPMENGEGLNPGQLTSDFAQYGQPVPQAALILPLPESDSIFLLIHLNREYTGVVNPSTITEELFYSKIDISANNGDGKVLEKNQLILNDTLDSGKLTTVRHANGRDWWLLVQKYDTNLFYRFLITPEGIIQMSFQQIGDNLYSGLGQSVFSPDGSKYVHFTTKNIALGQFVNIFNFDRCTGLLSDPRYVTYNDTAWAGGVAVSPNSRYLYVSSYLYVYQFDLQAEDIAASKDTVAVYDGFQAPFPTRFFMAQLAPDGKIYLNATNGVNILHVIHDPDQPGAACNFEQHGVQLPTYNAFSLPNFPNYRLGPLEGSLCDTLRSPPSAGFVYDAEELEVRFTSLTAFNPQNWYWDFGDGGTSEEKHPTHLYAEEGIYDVCLTVSNTFGSDTHCEQVEVIVTGTSSGLSSAAEKIRVWPNPAGDRLFIGFSDPAGKNLQVRLSDLLGRVHIRKNIHQGETHATIGTVHLPSGLYLLTVWEDGVIIGKVKIVVL
jgi:PKD repeat protein